MIQQEELMKNILRDNQVTLKHRHHQQHHHHY